MHTGKALARGSDAQDGRLSRTGHRVAVLLSWWVSGSVSSAGVQPLLCVALVVLVVGGDRDGRGAGTVDVRLESGLGGRTEGRVRLDHRVEVAVDDGLHRALGSVDRHDVHLVDARLAGV